MITTKKNSSGALFVRYITIGLVAIFSSIGLLKFSNIFLGNTSIVLGTSIFIINLLTVLGYTYAVLRDESLLAESDSPDLAYYLGFSLTVGALSATFIVDTLIGQQATAETKSDLVKNSLLQFGIGLTATLIGLCAKIYLSSKQNFEQTEPEELLRNFRQELNSFKNEMQSSSSEFANVLSESSKQLVESVTKAMDSFQRLNETIIKTNDEITNKIGSDDFSETIESFSETIKDLSNTSKNFVKTNDETISSMVDVTSALDKLNSVTELCALRLEQVDKKTQGVTISSDSLNLITTQLVDRYKTILPKTEQLSAAMGVAVETISKLNSSIDTANTRFVSGFGDNSELLTFKQSLSRVGEELKKLDALITKINNSRN